MSLLVILRIKAIGTYQNDEVTLKLPPGKKLSDFKWVSLWHHVQQVIISITYLLNFSFHSHISIESNCNHFVTKRSAILLPETQSV